MTEIFWRCTCLQKIRFVGEGFRKFEHEQEKQTDRRDRTPYQATFAGDKNASRRFFSCMHHLGFRLGRRKPTYTAWFQNAKCPSCTWRPLVYACTVNDCMRTRRVSRPLSVYRCQRCNCVRYVLWSSNGKFVRFMAAMFLCVPHIVAKSSCAMYVHVYKLIII